MPRSDDSAAKERLSRAYEEFEASLREMLTAEARRSVDGTLERLSAEAGPFRLHDVEVEVVIRNLSVAGASNTGTAQSRPSKRRPAARRRSATKPPKAKPDASRGRPPGRVRGALLAAFESTDELSTEALRDYLASEGVEANADNLHQHLRRLVKAGELQRSARGVYRRG